MHCEECKDQLMELVYEEGLRPRRKLELLNHVDNCPFCHEEYTDLLEARSLLQEWPDEETDWQLRVRPEYKARPGRILRWQRLRQRSWPVLRGAIAAMLVLAGLLAFTQSQVQWNQEGFTVQARLWNNDDATNTAGRRLSDRQLLAYVDRLIAASEQRQMQILYAAWEDSKARHQTDHISIISDVQGLQREVQTRWDNPQNRTQ